MKRVPIAAAPWGGAYRPAAFAALTREPEALVFTLSSAEAEPPARYRELNSPVYLDSCLEAFFRPWPERPEYLNFEMNANGALLLQLGPLRQERRFLTPEEFPGCWPSVCAFREPGGWGVRLRVPFAFLRAAFGVGAEPDPDAMCGNFYKCGENPRHYLCHAPVQAEKPDFHRSECFVPFRGLWNESDGAAF